MITVHATANCNVTYFQGLNGYEGKPKEALLSLLTKRWQSSGYPTYTYKVGPIGFQKYSCGVLLFALGSEHATMKYAHQLADYIRANKLGIVSEQPPAANPLHAGKPGILFVWTVDWTACETWWNKQSAEEKENAAKGQ